MGRRPESLQLTDVSSLHLLRCEEEVKQGIALLDVPQHPEKLDDTAP